MHDSIPDLIDLERLPQAATKPSGPWTKRRDGQGPDA